MTRTKIWVFDFDGTLVDSNHIKRECFFEVVRDDVNGATLMSSVLSRNDGDRAEIFKEYCDIREDPADRSRNLHSQYSSMVNGRVAKAKEMPGAVEFLELVRSLDAILVLSSATPFKDLVKILSMKSWLHKFDLVYGSPSKKQATIKDKLLKLVGSPLEIAVVGDGEDDLISAWSNGCKFFPIGDARGYRENGGTEEIHTFSSLRQKIFGTFGTIE